MLLTIGILVDFFEDIGGFICNNELNTRKKYENVKAYYSGAVLKEQCIYLIDEASYAQSDRINTAWDFCLLTSQVSCEADCALVVHIEKSVNEVLDLLQDYLQTLTRWDDALTAILLHDGSLQELLECSAPIFNAPCFLQDSNFYLLASCGEVAKEENQFFYDTLHTGRAPSGLFTQLLSMTPAEQPYASPKAISSSVKELRSQRVLIADCCVDGVAVLHFCLYYGASKRKGLSDLIIHLMQRMEAGPSIRLLTSKSTDLHDELFSKIIDAPDDGDFTNICSTLGLFRFQRFTVVCTDIGSQPETVDGRMTKLRALYPRFWFFRYQNQLYALMGSSTENKENDLIMQKSLLQQLQAIGASFGCSLDLFTPATLKMACQQAFEALSLARTFSAEYKDILVDHMIDRFFAEHSFAFYCPEMFQRLLSDDKNQRTNNLLLLYTYLSNNCNATAVSRILHMHRNNVIYRMEKICAKYQFDLEDGRTRLLLQILARKAIADV